MPVFKSIREVEAELARYIPVVKEITGKDISLARMRPLMAALNNPQDRLKIIHIAGTSGKTSTAYYLAHMLAATGSSVGLTVSPHIDSVTERVQLNGRPLPADEFCRAFGQFLNVLGEFLPRPSYFELLVAFAYWYFDQKEVDYAVVETGFGGLHDGTNIAQSPHKLCVITDIGYDHTHILGNTLPKIAAQKAGIIHRGNQVFMYRQKPEVDEVFQKRITEVGATANMFEQTELAARYHAEGFSILPLFQQRNWLLARAVCDAIAEREGQEPSREAIAASLNIQVPGRMEIRTLNGKQLVMDGAHNEQKTLALVRSFKQAYPGQKAGILLSLKEGKSSKKILAALKPICSRLVVTTFHVLQDVPSRSIDPSKVVAEAKHMGFTDVQTVVDPEAAFKSLNNSTEQVLLVTGSFYLLSCIRPLLHDS